MNHAELKAKLLQNPETQLVYDNLSTEFALLRQMLAAREEAGLSQAEVAKRMGTKAPAVARLEASLMTGKHSPSLATLRRYAEAVGCTLEVKLAQSHRADDVTHGVS
ncbi:helix-turn-helix transcriptional regulator [Synechococcus sp. C9]|jgi:transcriptional regulator with XRE-family HTH domain|uniref:helix-turn-helix domain-containing protein n=1 Tax=Synechococcus sp. C9 TaxID=102119 RepID=UPI001FF2EF7D|nr:helix-turn-helix transcriptional regulator [Synechococcus sp. C9]